jgi:hypothetical protein
MDALRKAAAVAAGGISNLDRGIRAQARDAAEKQMSDAEARRRAAALMAPSANTAAATHTGGGGGGSAGAGAPSAAAGGRSPAPDAGGMGAAVAMSTPASSRRRPASPGASYGNAPGGGGGTPGGAAALAADVYGELEALQRATLGSPATPNDAGAYAGAAYAGGGNGFDISALADMLRIDVAARCGAGGTHLTREGRTRSARSAQRAAWKGQP